MEVRASFFGLATLTLSSLGPLRFRMGFDTISIAGPERIYTPEVSIISDTTNDMHCAFHVSAARNHHPEMVGLMVSTLGDWKREQVVEHAEWACMDAVGAGCRRCREEGGMGKGCRGERGAGAK